MKYTTNKGVSGILGQHGDVETLYDRYSFKNNLMTPDDPENCLTSLQITTGNWLYGDSDKIFNAEIEWNADTPQYSSSKCESYRESSAAAGAIVGAVFGVLCFLGCGWAIWFFFFRRTGNKDTELKPRTPTPDAPAQQTTTTTTIIQQQP